MNDRIGEGTTTLDMLKHNHPWLKELLAKNIEMLEVTAEVLRRTAHTSWWDPQPTEEGATRHYCWCPGDNSEMVDDPREWEHDMRCQEASSQLRTVWRYLDEQRP